VIFMKRPLFTNDVRTKGKGDQGKKIIF